MRWLIIFVAALTAASAAAPALRAQEVVLENELMKTEGKVTEVDWVANAIAVSGPDGETVFTLTPETVVMAQAEETVRSNLEQGQHVEVYYVNGPDGSAKAVRIIITDAML